MDARGPALRSGIASPNRCPASRACRANLAVTASATPPMSVAREGAPTRSAAVHAYFAWCRPGLDGLLKAELSRLGIADPRTTRGGVAFTGTLDVAYATCLWSHLAGGVELELARGPATARDLALALEGVDWAAHVGPGRAVSIRTTGRANALAPEEAAGLVRAHIARALARRGGEAPRFVRLEESELALSLHLARGEASIALDLAGAPLDWRTGEAVPREDPPASVIAALLIRAGWLELARVGAPLLDPAGGRGTLAIEAALYAADVAPGLLRDRFAFTAWRGHDVGRWRALRELAVTRQLAGRERMTSWIGAAGGDPAVGREKARRAGLAGRVAFEPSLPDAWPPAELSPGLVASALDFDTSPVAARRLVRDLARRAPSWRGAFLAPPHSSREIASLGLEPRKELDGVAMSLVGELAIAAGRSPSAATSGPPEVALDAPPAGPVDRGARPEATVAPEPDAEASIVAEPARAPEAEPVVAETPREAAPEVVIAEAPREAAVEDVTPLAVAVGAIDESEPPEARAEPASDGVSEDASVPPVLDPSALAITGSAPDRGTAALASRMRKNVKRLARWLATADTDAYRIYERDLPEYNAIVDRYGDRLYVQELAAPAGIDPHLAARRLEEIVTVATDVTLVPRERTHVVQRRRQRGRDQYARRDHQGATFAVHEGAATLLVNLEDYLDTGLFLDHRPLRRRIGAHASGKRFLNLFCYTASATVHAARGGAIATTSVDLSPRYLAWARDNLAANDLDSAAHALVRADVLAFLEVAPAVPYDLVLLDPPTFSNSKRTRTVLDVQRDHVALVRAAHAQLAPGGTLFFSTNARHFELDAPALADLAPADITADTLDPDASRVRLPHRCWAIPARP